VNPSHPSARPPGPSPPGQAPTPAIVSASRRTDIPAFLSAWLLGRLRAGFCEVVNPFSAQRQVVSLAAGDVSGFVLWTKDPGPLLAELDEVQARAPFYVQFTITGHGAWLEPGVTPWQDAVEHARCLSARYGPAAVVWRFDPVVCTPATPAAEVVERFRRLARALEGAVEDCVISFMAPYRRQARAFAAAGLTHQELPAPERRALALELASVGREHGISLAACCTPDVAGEGVGLSSCIDPARLRRLGAAVAGPVREAPSRPGCHCARCVDIGAYDLCGGGCLYCYANRDHGLAARKLRGHDPAHLALADARPVG
jgi:hypothetical protein